MIDVLYFASLRERVGTASERMELPGKATVAGLMRVLNERGGPWGEAFGGGAPLLAAVNQEMARPEHSLRDGDEVAFFPPVTGG